MVVQCFRVKIIEFHDCRQSYVLRHDLDKLLEAGKVIDDHGFNNDSNASLAESKKPRRKHSASHAPVVILLGAKCEHVRMIDCVLHHRNALLDVAHDVQMHHET